MAYSPEYAMELEEKVQQLEEALEAAIVREARANDAHRLEVSALEGENEEMRVQNAELRDQVEEREDRIAEYAEGDRSYYEITERLTDERNRARAAILQARLDLRGLSEVPLSDLEASINDIRTALKEGL